MRRLHPADELAEIRSELARLHRREAELTAAILRSPDGAATGLYNAAEVTETRRMVLDPALLPPDLQADPRLWREEVTHVITTTPVRSRPLPLRPGWPICRTPQATLPQAVKPPALPPTALSQTAIGPATALAATAPVTTGLASPRLPLH